MYKAAVRWMIRRNIAALNEGRPEPALAMFADDAELDFPGLNSWSRQFRRPTTGRHPFATHRGARRDRGVHPALRRPSHPDGH